MRTPEQLQEFLDWVHQEQDISKLQNVFDRGKKEIPSLAGEGLAQQKKIQRELWKRIVELTNKPAAASQVEYYEVVEVRQRQPDLSSPEYIGVWFSHFIVPFICISLLGLLDRKPTLSLTEMWFFSFALSGGLATILTIKQWLSDRTARE